MSLSKTHPCMPTNVSGGPAASPLAFHVTHPFLAPPIRRSTGMLTSPLSSAHHGPVCSHVWSFCKEATTSELLSRSRRMSTVLRAFHVATSPPSMCLGPCRPSLHSSPPPLSASSPALTGLNGSIGGLFRHLAFTKIQPCTGTWPKEKMCIFTTPTSEVSSTSSINLQRSPLRNTLTHLEVALFSARTTWSSFASQMTFLPPAGNVRLSPLSRQVVSSLKFSHAPPSALRNDIHSST
mmetsp:Transcript_23280/g.46791  ORF Transcript_23280/g.46791 Transcript_23280/m.46791 type:complete len:237 (-) Transcript_23280:43-753(-)